MGTYITSYNTLKIVVTHNSAVLELCMSIHELLSKNAVFAKGCFNICTLLTRHRASVLKVGVPCGLRSL